VEGIEGVIDAYKYCLNKIKFYGPTHFAEVLKLVVDFAESARQTRRKQQYFILLLLTDGIINDMQETID